MTPKTIKCSGCPSLIIGPEQRARSYARKHWWILERRKADPMQIENICPRCQAKERKAKV